MVAAPSLRTVVLSNEPELVTRLAAVAQSFSSARRSGLAFVLVEGDVRAAVAQRREHEPSSRIGFAAKDEPSVLAALAGGADEAQVFSELDAAHLNAFIDRLELRALQRASSNKATSALVHAEKLAALGTLIAGIGHEINNPLSSVLMSLFVLRTRLLPALDAARVAADAVAAGRVPSDADVAALHALRSTRRTQDVSSLLDDVNTAAESIATIVRDLRIFARNEAREPLEVVEVSALIDQVLRLVGRGLSTRAVLERDYAPELPPLILPRNRVAQALTNLLVNAMHAIAEVERPVHVIRIHVRTDDEHLAIAIHDTGPGIAPDDLERIFDPFFTTKRAEIGTGLGLSISRSILRDLGGDLAVESVHGQGATFICLLPLTPAHALESSDAQRLSTPRNRVPRHGLRVLVVEDDPRVLRSHARLLSGEHDLIFANDAREAIGILEAGPPPDALVVELDLMSGDVGELLTWIEARGGALATRTAIIASCDAEQRHGPLLHRFPGRVLTKPLRGEALLEVLARMTQSAGERARAALG